MFAFLVGRVLTDDDGRNSYPMKPSLYVRVEMSVSSGR